jgi:hypothetical protein
MPDTEDPAGLVAMVDGRIPLAIRWHQIVFDLDPDDTTSDPDDLTVIRTSDNYVYKSGSPDLRILSALSDTVEGPPEDAAIDDIYLVPAGATGDWAGHQDDIAKLTRNGWRYEVPKVGKWLLIEDVDGFKRYSSTGWEYGPGVRSFDDASIPLSASLGWGERVIVENQTVTTLPTATKGLRFVIGSGATGVALGKDKQIAICEVAGTWTFYPPSNGWAIFDKALNNSFTYSGTAWVSSAGAYVGFACSELNVAGTNTTARSPGGAAYGYSPSTAPTTGHWRRTDDEGVTYAAKRSSEEPNPTLEISWSADCDWSNLGDFSDVISWGLFRDSESNAIYWGRIGRIGSENLVQYVSVTSLIPAVDANEHHYFFAIMNSGVNGSNLIQSSGMVRRRTVLRELV